MINSQNLWAINTFLFEYIKTTNSVHVLTKAWERFQTTSLKWCAFDEDNSVEECVICTHRYGLKNGCVKHSKHVDIKEKDNDRPIKKCLLTSDIEENRMDFDNASISSIWMDSYELVDILPLSLSLFLSHTLSLSNSLYNYVYLSHTHTHTHYPSLVISSININRSLVNASDFES